MQGRKKEFFALLKKFFLTPKIRAWHKGLFPMNTIVNMSFYIQKSLLINTKAITIDSLNFIESTKCVDESAGPKICVGSSNQVVWTKGTLNIFSKFPKIFVPGPNGNRMVKTSNFQKPFHHSISEALENVPGLSTKILGIFKKKFYDPFYCVEDVDILNQKWPTR